LYERASCFLLHYDVIGPLQVLITGIGLLLVAVVGSGIITSCVRPEKKAKK